eukprot:CAMPEP_0168561090 /NCGR_PEP_ID=MMETSP0413-20121227/11406_1 /TAXON_ID=136452 /ORGANISM="Filamoeba nolandi, Strain NC-AS-23-1" /LENGTH=439 /DNA_ID=CAMNT_0008592431 /DNA_START=305 /DNA_END=1624 /DNA_ORIENTATION=+
MLIRDPELRAYLFDRFTTKRTLMASIISGQPEAHVSNPEFHPLVNQSMRFLSKQLFHYAARGPVSFFMPVGAPPPQSKADPYHELYQLKLKMGLIKPIEQIKTTTDGSETEREKEKALIEKITKQIPLKGSTRAMKSLGSVYLGLDWESKMKYGGYLFQRGSLSDFAFMRLAKYSRMFEGFTLGEAYVYLNIKEPIVERLDPMWLLLKARHLFTMNDPRKGGSSYLQAKVIFALMYLLHHQAITDSSVDFTDPLTKWSNEELANNNPEKRLAALADFTSNFQDASDRIDRGEAHLKEFADFLFVPPAIQTHPLWEHVDKTFTDLAEEIRNIEPELHELQREIERRRPDLQKEKEKALQTAMPKSRTPKRYRPRMRNVSTTNLKEGQQWTMPKPPPSSALLSYMFSGAEQVGQPHKEYGTGASHYDEIQQANEEDQKRGK